MLEKLKRKGMIISIVGNSSSGKSTLAKLLAKHYGGVLIEEGEPHTYPRRIQDNLEEKEWNKNLQTILWFRNKQIKNYMVAQKFKEEGNIVILDTSHYTHMFYHNELIDPFDRYVANELGRIDLQIFPWPDITIYIKSTKDTIKEFIAKRKIKRIYEDEERIKLLERVNNVIEKFFLKYKQIIPNLIIVERESVDFLENPKDFEKLVKIIDSKIHPIKLGKETKSM